MERGPEQIAPKVYPSNQTSIISWLERGLFARNWLILKRHQADENVIRLVYQACESAKEGKEDSTAAFISRFIQICLRVVCSQPTPTSTPAPPVAPPPRAESSFSHGTGAQTLQASPAATSTALPPQLSPGETLSLPAQLDVADLFDPSHSLAQTLGGDTTYWYVSASFRAGFGMSLTLCPVRLQGESLPWSSE